MSAGRVGDRFDSLVHVTSSGTWLNGRDDASLDRLVREMDRAGVSRACLVGLPGVNDPAEILDCAGRAGGRFVPVAGFDPTASREGTAVAGEVASLRAAGFRGVKLHPRLGGYHPLHPRVVDTINAAAAHGLVVFLDTLFRQRARATASAPDVIDRLAHRCPGAAIVLLHGGGADVLRVAEIVRAHPALVLDVSYTLLAYRHSSVSADLRWIFEKLDQRVVVGSDMPEFTPGDAFDEAERLAEGIPDAKWANIAYGNLARLFPST